MQTQLLIKFWGKFKRRKMSIFKEVTKNNEFYLYMNGKLIYKKWLLTGQSKVFDVMAYDKFTSKSITQESIKKEKNNSKKCK